MIWFLICLFIQSAADKFNTTDIINDFTIRNDKFYVTTPNNSYLLNNSLQIQHEFSKQFSKSMWLYINETSYLECGVRTSSSGVCCYQRNTATLGSILESKSDNLCDLFKDNRYFFPYYYGKQFFVLTSYLQTGGGRTSRIHIEGGLKYSVRDDLHVGSQQDRFIVISPMVEKFTKYIVVLKSKTKSNVFYFDPDIDILLTYQTPVDLKCNGKNKNGISGFSLLADPSLNLQKSLINYDYNMHFILFEQEPSYCICVYMEGLKENMYRESPDKIVTASAKQSLVKLSTKVGKIRSLNGLFVNKGLTIYYSVGRNLYKVRYL